MQDEEAYLPIFTDLFYFMKWYEALPPADREGLDMRAYVGFKMFDDGLAFMDQGWASSVVVNPGTALEYRVQRSEWREMLAIMMNKAQLNAESNQHRPVPDPALDAFEIGSPDNVNL